MKKTMFLISFVLILVLNLSQAQKYSPEVEEYIKLNNAESRLSDYKDNNDILSLKVRQLAVINSSRKKHKALPVKLDILASRVANKMALDAAINNYRGHFNLNGENPYMRYALAGGVDHVVENAAASSASVAFDPEDENILERMYELHQAFMAEKAPNDGHKQTCIAKHFNYVGIGIGWKDGEFRYYEEYIDRYLNIKKADIEVDAGSDISVIAKPLSSEMFIHYVVAYYQLPPKKMTAKQVSAIPSYNDFTEQTVADMAPWELPPPAEDGYFDIRIPTKKKGLYYIQIYLDNQPYKKGKATTEGKICGSGIVVDVK